MNLERDLARFAALDAIRIDGAPWYRYAQVCRALRVPERKGARAVDAIHKRRYFEYHKGYRSTVILLLDRAGVEQMVIRYASAPRAALMGALDGAHEARAMRRIAE